MWWLNGSAVVPGSNPAYLTLENSEDNLRTQSE